MTKVHVWHNISGNIMAVGRVVGEAKCLAVPSGDQLVTEIDVEESSISSLYRTHIIDVIQKTAIEIRTLNRSKLSVNKQNAPKTRKTSDQPTSRSS